MRQPNEALRQRIAVNYQFEGLQETEALEYIQKDEYVEVTPHYLRLRKIILNEGERRKAERSALD